MKPGSWCPSCRAVHAGVCPKKIAWDKPAFKKSGRGGRPWQRKRESVFKRDGFLCQICLRNGKQTVVTLHGSLAGVCDHVIALAVGGSDDESNLQTICKNCDKIKTHAESQKGRGGSKVRVP